MKNIIKTVGIILVACALILAAVFASREYKERVPVITVKEHGVLVKPGDTVDTNDLFEVKVKGEYDQECNIIAGHDNCDMDESGILHIHDNGQKGMSTIIIECTAVGSTNKSCKERVDINVQNPLGENNSYEVSASDVRFRVYNDLKEQGNGAFMSGSGLSDGDYQVVFHSADTVSSMDELEAEIKKYAKEKYLLNEAEADYQSKNVTLSSGKKARKITFSAIRSQGEYLVLGESSGLVVKVTVYAFGEDDRYFFIDDDNPWYSEYEMEQIANTVA